MKPAHPRHKTDCVASALASILELPIENLPSFWSEKTPHPGQQYEKIRKWVATRGFHYYYSSISPRSVAALRKETIEPGTSWPPRGYWIGQIARVEWLRDHEPNHLVVMKDRRVVFNPAGTIKETHEDDVWLIGYYLLVPLDPAKP